MDEYKPSEKMKAIAAGARARYMDYDTQHLADLREALVEAAIAPQVEDATFWLFREGVRNIDDIVMGRAVV